MQQNAPATFQRWSLNRLKHVSWTSGHLGDGSAAAADDDAEVSLAELEEYSEDFGVARRLRPLQRPPPFQIGGLEPGPALQQHSRLGCATGTILRGADPTAGRLQRAVREAPFEAHRAVLAVDGGPHERGAAVFGRPAIDLCPAPDECLHLRRAVLERRPAQRRVPVPETARAAPAHAAPSEGESVAQHVSLRQRGGKARDRFS